MFTDYKRRFCVAEGRSGQNRQIPTLGQRNRKERKGNFQSLRAVTCLTFFYAVATLASPSNAQVFDWGPNPLNDDWHGIFNWSGGDIFNPIPNNTSEAARIQPNTVNSPILYANVTIGGLTIQPGGFLRSGNYNLLINPGSGTAGVTRIKTNGFLALQGGTLDTERLFIDGELSIEAGGLTQVDDDGAISASGRLVLFNGTLEGGPILVGGLIRSDNTDRIDSNLTLTDGDIDVAYNMTLGGVVTMDTDSFVFSTFGDGCLIVEDYVQNDGGNITLSKAIIETGAQITATNTPTLFLGSLEGGGHIDLDSTAELNVGFTDASSTFSGRIFGEGGFVKEGIGTLTLTGNHPYSGETRIQSGVLKLDGNARLSDQTHVHVEDEGIFQLESIPDAIWRLTGSGFVQLNGTTNLVIGNGTNEGGVGTFSGTFSGTGKLEKRGLGTFTLTGEENSYSGQTLITRGTLSVTNPSGSATGSGDIHVEPDGTMIIDGGSIVGDVMEVEGSVHMTGGSLNLSDELGFDVGTFGMTGGRLITPCIIGDLTLEGGTLAIPELESATEISDGFTLGSVDSSVSNHGTQYSEDGFTISSNGDMLLATYGTQQERYSGSTALFENAFPGQVTLSKDDGGAFSLTSINLAELIGDGAGDVTFVGQLSGGGETSQTFTLDGIAFEQETFFFDKSFGNVSSVSWVLGSPFHQFDDIVFGDPVDPGGLLGDVNLDGDVNLLDVQPFINVLSSGQYQAEADTNQDGIVNLLDVDSFIDLISGV